MRNVLHDCVFLRLFDLRLAYALGLESKKKGDLLITSFPVTVALRR